MRYFKYSPFTYLLPRHMYDVIATRTLCGCKYLYFGSHSFRLPVYLLVSFRLSNFTSPIRFLSLFSTISFLLPTICNAKPVNTHQVLSKRASNRCALHWKSPKNSLNVSFFAQNYSGNYHSKRAEKCINFKTPAFTLSSWKCFETNPSNTAATI